MQQNSHDNGVTWRHDVDSGQGFVVSFVVKGADQREAASTLMLKAASFQDF